MSRRDAVELVAFLALYIVLASVSMGAILTLGMGAIS